MDRREVLLKEISKDHLGVEIAPWHSPLVAKAAGYNSLSLDVFGTDKLLEIARADPHVPNDLLARIEAVDLVGSATDIAAIVESKGLTGKLDYIISSHNFEHLPNPIMFLQGCEKALKPGGLLSMAIPDKRRCFDFFRPHSTTADFIEAHKEMRVKPNPYQRFSQNSLHSHILRDGNELGSYLASDDVAEIVPVKGLDRAHEVDWVAKEEYQDTHCSVFTPSSCRIIFEDIRFLGYSSLVLEDLVPTDSNEFYVRLRKPVAPVAIDTAQFYETRTRLLHETHDELARSSRYARELERELTQLRSLPKESPRDFLSTVKRKIRRAMGTRAN